MVLVGPFVSVMRSSRLPATPSLAGPGVALSAVCTADLGSRMSSGVESSRGEGGTVPLCLRLFDMLLSPPCDCCSSSIGSNFGMVSGSVAAAVLCVMWVAATCCWASDGDGEWSGAAART